MEYLSIAVIIFAYLIGSLNFAVIFTNAFTKKDVRDFGSGNAGTTNVMRSAGFLPGALTFLCDVLKGLIACFAGKLLFEYILAQTGTEFFQGINGAYICGIACMLGHVFPLFFGFKGGKGVATSVGIFAVCCPIAVISGLSVFTVLTLLTKYVSLSSLVATLTVAVLAIVFRVDNAVVYPQIVCTLLMAVTITLKHSGNIKRLINGTENKIGGKKKHE